MFQNPAEELSDEQRAGLLELLASSREVVAMAPSASAAIETLRNFLTTYARAVEVHLGTPKD